MQPVPTELNTDISGATFSKLTRLYKTAADAKASPVAILADPLLLESLVLKQFRQLCELQTEKLVTRAIERMLLNGRWDRPDLAAVICEVMTDKQIRKGSLSDTGRRQRHEQIRIAMEEGDVRFCTLILPFRIPSPLKNRGVLPDIGELYTLTILKSLVGAANRAQSVLAGRVELLDRSFSGLSTGFIRQTGETVLPTTTVTAILDEVLRQLPVKDAAGRIKKSLRAMFSRPISVSVYDPGLFAHFVLALDRHGLTLPAYLAIQGANPCPVTIAAVQDAGRYPCFDNIDGSIISAYRGWLLKALTRIWGEQKELQLLDYRTLCGAPDQHRNSRYKDRFTSLCSLLNEQMELLLTASGKHCFYTALQKVGCDAPLAQLFEPVLLSMQYEVISQAAEKSGVCKEALYLDLMVNIYTPQEGATEALRRTILQQSLCGTVQYCAAYDANSGARNKEAFDDIQHIFPGALRLSIHRKDEHLGHFSVSVTPSHDRTPWHGSAFIDLHDDEERLIVGIDLALSLERKGFVPIYSRESPGGLFDEHALARQPVFYLSDNAVRTYGINILQDISARRFTVSDAVQSDLHPLLPQSGVDCGSP